MPRGRWLFRSKVVGFVAGTGLLVTACLGMAIWICRWISASGTMAGWPRSSRTRSLAWR